MEKGLRHQEFDSLTKRLILLGMRVNAHTIGLVTVMRNSIILAVLRAHFSATCTASILGVSSPIKTTNIVDTAVAEIVAITVGWPPPTVLIANDVPTEATRMLNKFPTRRIVPKNLSCSPKILITYFAFLGIGISPFFNWIVISKTSVTISITFYGFM